MGEFRPVQGPVSWISASRLYVKQLAEILLRGLVELRLRADLERSVRVPLNRPVLKRPGNRL